MFFGGFFDEHYWFQLVGLDLMADDLMVMMGPCRASIQLASQGTTTMGV
jgi:hypothetical protein